MLEDIDHIITGITNILTGHTLTGENEAWLSLAEEAKSDIDARVNRIYSLSKKLSK